MLTLNQIVSNLKEIQQGNALLKKGSFYFGDPWEFGASSEITYPFVGAWLQPGTINDKISTTSFTIFFCDLVNKDEGNETEVLSDMITAAHQFWAQLKWIVENNYYGIAIEINSNINPFTERFDDEVTGVELTIKIDQFFDQSVCDSPVIDSGKVLIKNLETGEIIATLSPGSEYFVTILSHIKDTIDTNQYTIIEPLT